MNRLHILVAANAAVRLSVRRLLWDLGHEIELVSSCRDAMQRMQARIPHIVIADHEMDYFDGLDLARELRRLNFLANDSKGFKRVEIIILTSDSVQVMKTLRDGEAQRLKLLFASKPVTEAGLVEPLLQAVGIRSRLGRSTRHVLRAA